MDKIFEKLPALSSNSKNGISKRIKSHNTSESNAFLSENYKFRASQKNAKCKSENATPLSNKITFSSHRNLNLHEIHSDRPPSGVFNRVSLMSIPERVAKPKIKKAKLNTLKLSNNLTESIEEIDMVNDKNENRNNDTDDKYRMSPKLIEEEIHSDGSSENSKEVFKHSQNIGRWLKEANSDQSSFIPERNSTLRRKSRNPQLFINIRKRISMLTPRLKPTK